MRLNEDKVAKKPAEWAEYQRLSGFFGSAHSPIYLTSADEARARQRYEWLHSFFFTR